MTVNLPKDRPLLPPGVILGIDWGKKRIGLAVSDSSQAMVFPLKQLQASGLQADRVMMDRVLLEYGVKVIVVGWPMHVSGRSGQNCPEILKWVQTVCSFPGIPVFFADERYSSVMADQYLRETGRKASQRKGLIDSMAAREFLQEVISGGTRLWPMGSNPDETNLDG